MKKIYNFFWNNNYFIPEEKLIISNKNKKLGIYSSVVFILSPLYKIINFCLTEHPKQIYKFLKYKNLLSKFIFLDKNYKIFLKKILDYLFSYKKEILHQFFEFFHNPREGIINFFENNLNADIKVRLFIFSLSTEKNF